MKASKETSNVACNVDWEKYIALYNIFIAPGNEHKQKKPSFQNEITYATVLKYSWLNLNTFDQILAMYFQQNSSSNPNAASKFWENF